VFDVAAFRYLLKPIEEDKFRDVFRREERDEEMKSAESVRFVRSDYKTDNEKNGWSR
jgi:DNA-binding LytR/AlgR family response regulator